MNVVSDRKLRVTGFLTHSFEYSVAGLHILSALALCAGGLKAELTDTVMLGPLSLAPIMVGFLLGGIGMIAGPHWKEEVVGRAIERAGLYLLIAAWSAVTLIVLAVAPGAAFMVGAQALVVIAGCTGRAIALTRVDRAVEHIAAVASDFEKG